MKTIELHLSEMLYSRIREIAEKTSGKDWSDEMAIISVLVDGLAENEKMIKMMEDQKNGI